jgi:hypothetical protein
MYELSGKLTYNVSFTAKGNPIVSLELNERIPALKMVDDLHDSDKLVVKIYKFREKRSLNANNYAWKLITEIGNRTRQSKEDVYLTMLKRYGQSEMVSVLANVPFGKFVKYFDEVGESELNGKLFKHYRVYQGSSEFSTHEMSIFLDGVVSEAKDLGIPTDTPDRIAKMKGLWDA